MEKWSPFTSRSVVPAILLVVCGVAFVFSLRAYSLSREIERAQRTSLHALQSDVSRLRSQVSGLAGRLSARAKSSPFVFAAPDGPGTEQDNGVTPGGGPARAPQSPSLSHLEDVVNATGLGDLARERDVDPEFLKAMHDRFADRKRTAAVRAELIARSRELLGADEERYGGAELSQLYEVARSGQGAESDEALLTLLEKYPDAYSTGVVIAERALTAALNQSTPDVELCYNTLLENPNYATVVTEMGIEAVPAVQNYLVRQYIQAGRLEEAQTLLNDLGQDYGESYVAARGKKGEPEFRNVSEVVQELQQQIDTAASGGSVPSGSSGGSAPSAPVGGGRRGRGGPRR